MHSSFHHSTLSKMRRTALTKKVHAYGKKIQTLESKNEYELHESALYIAQDTKYQQGIKKSLARFSGVEHVVLVGIGGSNLGTEAVYRALAVASTPLLTVLDQIDIPSLKKLESLIANVRDKKKIVLVVVSKSGSTTETMMNGLKAIEVCEQKFGNTFHEQVICIGDSNTAFMEVGAKRNILCIPMPDIIGGRYSIFTAVGMVPLMLLGIDTAALRKGARAALTEAEMKRTEDAAVTLALHAEAGIHTVNFFTFDRQLEYIGKWYRQLLAESIGKSTTTAGTPFTHHLLPVVSTSADLHSMAQLYLGGYKGMYTHFVYIRGRESYRVARNHWLLEHVPFLSNRKFDDVEHAIIHGVRSAYDDQKLPYRDTELVQCSATSVGFLLTTLMLEVMYLAHALDVNAFDQPSVEFYKSHTRKALGL